MAIVSRIKSAVREGRYELTEHAIEEAEADNFNPTDVRHALLRGDVVKRYRHDPRGIRYAVRGPAMDGRFMLVICRFNEWRQVRVITVFAEQNES
jgi:hypothetical protein